jgi:CelD/BcsL family acetyltransferase involved in cellulose biosynthesis
VTNAVGRAPAHSYVNAATSLDAAAALAPEWSRLVDRSSGATPFQRPEWLIPWFEIFAPTSVHVLAARDACGRLIAILPGMLAGSRLELAGSPISDYRGAVVDDDAMQPAVDALRSAIERLGCACELDDIPEGSEWADRLREGARWRTHAACVCPAVPLPDSIDEWKRRLPGGLDRNIRRYGRRLADEADVTYATSASPHDATEGISALFRLHSRRWHERGSMGVLQSADVRRFHDSSAGPLLAAGVLRLHLLIANGHVIAAQYVLVQRHRAYSYIGGFAPEWARYGPGTLLMAYSIERAIEERCREFDLLRGAEPYKYAWGAVNHTTMRLVFGRDGDAC